MFDIDLSRSGIHHPCELRSNVLAGGKGFAPTCGTVRRFSAVERICRTVVESVPVPPAAMNIGR